MPQTPLPKTVDLMAALKASLEAAKKGKGAPVVEPVAADVQDESEDASAHVWHYHGDQSSTPTMNCVYCGSPVPKSATDSHGMPLMPESVHITCVVDRVVMIDKFLRKVEVDPRGTVISFPKYAPLTTVNMTEKGE